MSLGDAIGFAGLAVSVVGFWVAIVQLRRTAKATAATAAALKSALHRMNVNHLLVLLPQLRIIENDLDQAAHDDDRRLAQRTLISYAHTASQVASLLESSEEPVDSELVGKLRTSARLASASKATLVSTSRSTVKTATKDVSSEIGEIAGLAAGLIAQYQSKVA
ncbi:hypothetical protein [Cellulosimicrobium cellulans]|uniref:hypothetical protein n=1 Tax=Cellulosimicrobium cellulans TaxID=1710 RepID=UPI002097F8E3|nr:hypothetical protein [Cellulosimicrobium cellulans]MCO7275065.1 hypothetical protein [Cellulosimicrobium cellulans]